MLSCVGISLQLLTNLKINKNRNKKLANLIRETTLKVYKLCVGTLP